MTRPGFSQICRERPISQLSGGWRNRAALTKTPLEEPDMLLLDESANHLDIAGLEWLENWLRGFPGALQLVSMTGISSTEWSTAAKRARTPALHIGIWAGANAEQNGRPSSDCQRPVEGGRWLIGLGQESQGTKENAGVGPERRRFGGTSLTVRARSRKMEKNVPSPAGF